LLAVCRLVLAAISPFLSQLLSGQPDHLGEVTVLLPQVKRGILAILLDFIYTGTMQVSTQVPHHHLISWNVLITVCRITSKAH
jgi:hypothetical protein